MLQTFRKLRHATLVLVAAGSLAAMLAAPASASESVGYTDQWCGANEPASGVYTRACWYPYYDSQTGVFAGYVPGLKMRVAPNPLDPAKWSACEVRIAVYRKVPSSSTYTRLPYTGYGDCLGQMIHYSTRTTEAFRGFDSNFLYNPSPGYCYFTITRWLGTYNNQRVGMLSDSGPFAKSVTICGTYTIAGGTDGGATAPVMDDLGAARDFETPTVVLTPDAPGVSVG